MKQAELCRKMLCFGREWDSRGGALLFPSRRNRKAGSTPNHTGLSIESWPIRDCYYNFKSFSVHAYSVSQRVVYHEGARAAVPSAMPVCTIVHSMCIAHRQKYLAVPTLASATYVRRWPGAGDLHGCCCLLEKHRKLKSVSPLPQKNGYRGYLARLPDYFVHVHPGTTVSVRCSACLTDDLPCLHRL